jgi:hypothetical protein
MTEPNNQDAWGDVGTPTDLWRASKSLSAMSPEETSAAWAKTVDALDGMCVLAERLMLEPLLLAVVDAKIRSEEELERAADALHRPEGADLSEGEERRLLALMRRSDALNEACVAVEDWSVTPAAKEATLALLREMRDEASRNFEVYGREIGLPKGPLGEH